jgi:hypothetical protein
MDALNACRRVPISSLSEQARKAALRLETVIEMRDFPEENVRILSSRRVTSQRNDEGIRECALIDTLVCIGGYSNVGRNETSGRAYTYGTIDEYTGGVETEPALRPP